MKFLFIKANIYFFSSCSYIKLINFIDYFPKFNDLYIIDKFSYPKIFRTKIWHHMVSLIFYNYLTYIANVTSF